MSPQAATTTTKLGGISLGVEWFAKGKDGEKSVGGEKPTPSLMSAPNWSRKS